MKPHWIALVAITAALPGLAGAEGIGLGGKVSTLGLGLELTKSITPTINARAGINNFTYDQSGTEDDIDYDIDLKLQSAAAMADWHPFAGGFRLTGGVLFNKNKLEMTAAPAADYTIGATTYLAADVGSLSGEITFDDVVPYAGIGWGNAVKPGSRFSLTADVGVVFQGSPEASLTATGPITSTPGFQTDLRAEEDNLNKEMDGFEIYPVISAGMAYHF